jgi:hypothetical protein
MDTWVAAGAAFLLAMVAFRRARQVVTPEARRAAARQEAGSRSRRAVLAALTVVRVIVGLAALGGIVWLTRKLF